MLVDELFGAPLYRASIPAVVKVGDLAPYVELAWLTTPTPQEADWLKEEAARFQELITQLTAPAFGSMPFLQWLDARFVATTVPWFNLLKEQPEVCRAVLRLHHVGLLRLPARRPARPRSTGRRRPPTTGACSSTTGCAGTSPGPGSPRTSRSSRRYAGRCRPWATSGPSAGSAGAAARSTGCWPAASPRPPRSWRSSAAEHRNLGDGLRMLVL